MQEISNSLRQRLRARPEPQTHPDPDLLTAYVEQLLPSAERATVVEHLAECSHCREVVALSLPEPQQPAVAAHQPARPRWWIPAYRWAAAAATVAIAATLIIEKPWQQKQVQVQPPATVSEKSQSAPPVETVTNGEVASAPIAAGKAEPKLSAPSRTTAIIRDDSLPTGIASAPRGQRQASPAPKEPGVVGGVVTRSAAPSLAPPPPVPQNLLQAEHRADAYSTNGAFKDAEQDFVNRRAIGAESQTVEVTAESPVVAPEAPSPKADISSQRAAARRGKAVPPIKEESLAMSAMEATVSPPQTSTSATPPPASDTNLAKSTGFTYKLKSTLNAAVNSTVSAAKKVGGARKPPAAQSFSGAMAASPAPNIADSDKESRQQPVERIQWTVTSDGRLLRSNEVGQWHEAYQGADLQFRVVQQNLSGSEVWAGANHGTLIHSWNAGVNWSKQNVPDGADITAISIDGDDVQVKTSNGKTFVSNDHGKTWAPLNQNPQ